MFWRKKGQNKPLTREDVMHLLQQVGSSDKLDSLLKNPFEELICTGGEYAPTLPVIGTRSTQRRF
jgi:hypothetical protein